MSNNSFWQSLGAWLRAQGVVRVMRHGAYARFIASSWVYTIGFWMQRIGVGWLTWELTHSGAWLGAVAMSYALPAILLTPFAGAIADQDVAVFGNGRQVTADAIQHVGKTGVGEDHDRIRIIKQGGEPGFLEQKANGNDDDPGLRRDPVERHQFGAIR